MQLKKPKLAGQIVRWLIALWAIGSVVSRASDQAGAASVRSDTLHADAAYTRRAQP